MSSLFGVSAILLAAMLAAATAHAQDGRIGFGLRVGVAAADGEPANDIPGAGVVAHYALSDQWILGAGVDRTEYDFEEPAKILGIAQDPALEPIDALAEATTVSVWLERSISDRSRPTVWFVGAGLAAAFVDVPDVTGARANGGRFDIRTEVDTETVVFALVGARRHFGERWYGEVAAKAEQHFADWRITDRVSGAQGAIDDYLAWGAYVAVGVRW